MEELSIKKENKAEEEKSFFEKRYEKDILPLIDALCSEEEPLEDFRKRMRIDLEESLKKIQVAQGKLIEHDENKNIEEIKAILISRVKSVLGDDKRYRYTGRKRLEEKRPDKELVLRSKIVLLLAGDLSDLKEQKGGKDEFSIDKLDFESLSYYLQAHSYDTKRKLSEKEINELIEAGFVKQLAKITEHSFNFNFENVPELLFIELIKNKNIDVFWLDEILKTYSSQKKYSHEVSKELISRGAGYIVLNNIEKFDDLNLDYLKSLIMIYSPDHPFHTQKIIEDLEKLNLQNDEKEETIDFTFKHNNIDFPEVFDIISNKKIKDKYKKIFKDIEFILKENNSLGFNSPKELSKEKLLFLKENIEKGYVTFLYPFKGYLNYFLENSYEWLLSHIIKNDQENLLLVFDKLKDVDQKKYAEKLVEKNEINILKILIERKCFSKEVLSQRIFEELIENDYIAPLDYFNNLNEENFIYLLKNKFKNWEEVKANLRYFTLPEGCQSREVMNEIVGITNSSNLQYYYVNNFIDKNKEERSHILDLISEATINFQSFNVIVFYIEKFRDNGKKEEREAYIKKLSKCINDISKNISIKYSNENEYKVLCEVVYPKRNYDTFKYISEYKDRSEDLDSYVFDKNGYPMCLSGVVGYKIKEGQIKNKNVLVNYQNRIKNINDLAKSNENIIDYISRNLPDTESKTLEGKIIEYVRKNRNDSNSIDLLLAYQLKGNYDQFVRESIDRTDMYEKMEGKEYVMLSELSERYGDLMKETLKEIGKKVSNSEDKKLFVKDNKDDIKKGEELSGKIFIELSRIPEDKLTTEAIQKKVAKSIKSTFQNNKHIKDIAETFSGSFSKDNLYNFENIFKEKIKKIFEQENSEVELDIKELEVIRQKTYEEIKSELDKYEEIKEIDEDRKGEVKMSKERLIKGYFSKNKENAHARMIGDVCIATDPKMLENKNYFEFVFFDEDRRKCVGTTMLLRMEELEGKKYLLYCPNPSVDLVSQVSAEKLYKLITREIVNFAKENKFDGVLVDKRHGHSTNRSGLFQTSLEKSILHDERGGDIVFNLKNKHQLSNNYVYQENLNAVWIK